jgi:hypothetical protein
MTLFMFESPAVVTERTNSVHINLLTITITITTTEALFFEVVYMGPQQQRKESTYCGERFAWMAL